jgi:phage gp36-like protein
MDDIETIVPEQDLIQLTDDAVPATAIVTANVQKAVSDSGELIDGYLRHRYTLPLDPVPGLINTLACDIAIYRLYARRPKLAPPEGIVDRYKEAIALLRQIQKGDITLGTGAVVTPETATESISATSATRIFTRDTMEGY